MFPSPKQLLQISVRYQGIFTQEFKYQFSKSKKLNNQTFSFSTLERKRRNSVVFLISLEKIEETVNVAFDRIGWLSFTEIMVAYGNIY